MARRWASCVFVAGSVMAGMPSRNAPAGVVGSSPIFGVSIPDGYRHWKLVGIAQETGALNELRAVLGNAPAMQAYQAGALPFPDGPVLVKLAWKRE